MSDLNRREAMKRATSTGLAATASTLLAGTVRAEGDQEGQPGTAAPDKQSAIVANNHVPITIFIRGKQQIQLTGQKPGPGAPKWVARADDPSIVNVAVQPVEVGSLPVDHWELTITGLKMGNTQVHVQETVAPAVRVPVRVLYDFVLDVTVLGLPA
jgi:hypothetical protein